MTLEIRRVRTTDVDTFRTARIAAVNDTPLAFGVTPQSLLAQTQQQWQDRVDLLATHPTEAMYLAIDGEQAVAMMGAYFEDEDDCWVLMSVWVAPDHRGTGLTERLHDEVLAWAKAQGAEQIFLDVVVRNQRAVGFYKRVGYTPTGIVKKHHLHTDEDEVEMVMPLV